MDLAGLVQFAQSIFYLPLMMLAFGLFMSTMHLGKPKRFYRGFNNLRHSPVSREGLGIALFMAFLGLHIACSLPANALVAQLASAVGLELAPWQGLAAKGATMFGALALPSGLTGLYYMNRCYRIKARPFWNHWQVGTAFFGNMFSLDALVCALLLTGADWNGALLAAGRALAGLVLLACCLISRALFYVLVIPTTMPGAFFWKNKGFEQHARDIGLAHMPQVGVVPLSHWDQLLSQGLVCNWKICRARAA
ncbi:dimethyl sulfoxide reductase anchor subunit [Pseudomonas sp. HAR-UPW-AIA-41]|uniref:dimethyl sulfoxide reductase anchor subunit family protein n=1 Tax=Pseudomonas sp. HAR-UPW-AIA-41 TaxID=1985301 RepID=UPI001C4742AE|nr:dimethyl sulfoxide reductase anchor subunit [Pseudomonas sp. HAR-UPW-AIA-41]